MSRPLTDKELARWENNIARASAIGRRLVILAEIEEDPDVLELFLDAISAAERLRLDLIAMRDESKDGRKQ